MRLNIYEVYMFTNKSMSKKFIIRFILCIIIPVIVITIIVKIAQINSPSRQRISHNSEISISVRKYFK